MDPFEAFCQKHGIKNDDLTPSTRKVPSTPREILEEFARCNGLSAAHIEEGLRQARKEK